MASTEHDTLALSSLCKELITSCEDVSSFVDRLIQQVRSSTSALGLSLLDVKNDTLLSYVHNVIYVILKKCHGMRLESDKTIERLIEQRVVLERIIPLEQKLKYQIEKLVKTSLTGKIDPTDKRTYKANPEEMANGFELSDSDVDEHKNVDGDSTNRNKREKSGVYVPPKLAAVAYEDDNKATKEQKALERARKKALNSSVMQELKEEYLDAPVEISHTNTLRNAKLKWEKEKESYEETFFTRLPVSKKEKQRAKLMNMFTVGKLGADVTNFEDVSALDDILSSHTLQGKKRKKSSQQHKRKKSGLKKRKI